MKPSTHRRAKGAAWHGTPGHALPSVAPAFDVAPEAAWQPICRLDELALDTGIAARAHGSQIAVFLTEAGLFALDHVDPFCGAAVLARGIVGDIQGHPVVASPMYKQHFRLDTGQCLEDPTVRVRRWPLRVDADGVLLVGRPETPHAPETHHATDTAA
ncbi:MAG: nitrite reductase small subunit NirD [Castellaniella sp.]|uniref:nitrite reductase small subunit NirD n=1 Tax=Castellaniella sp. TaxID=1955812 RepID=UPI002A36B30A|nr:nitrite reductase small subunit NirD [Castellaniella sp.]MDY0310370.1 nitrite reductase small subunit NirD [Castellaniella sp.]